ncbi:hypothetical protein EXIGLDRAFT_733557 [Exidia glandulosa HHB12029]|uniref:Uncharacterized protein n=1 Tax=Exidia glandulosa HHB12029 TaxID=1314781 RepID=A0A165B9R2_EXIGL|nr:hypothetical protein EXIGLDRAFT_733557 [Exidia glandulosa HHB12029]
MPSMTSGLLPRLEALFTTTSSHLETRLRDASSGLSWTFNVPLRLGATFIAVLARKIPGFEQLSSRGFVDDEWASFYQDSDSGDISTDRARGPGRRSLAQRSRSASPQRQRRQENLNVPRHPRELHRIVREFQHELRMHGIDDVLREEREVEYECLRGLRSHVETAANYDGAPPVQHGHDDSDSSSASGSASEEGTSDEDDDKDDLPDLADELPPNVANGIPPPLPPMGFKNREGIRIWREQVAVLHYGDPCPASHSDSVKMLDIITKASSSKNPGKSIRNKVMATFPHATKTFRVPTVAF